MRCLARICLYCLLIAAAYSVNAQSLRRIPDDELTATNVVSDGKYTWIATPNGAYRVDGDSVKRIPDLKLNVRGIFVLEGAVWLATTYGAYRVDGDKATRFPDKGLVVTSITEYDNHIWIGSTIGSFRVDGDTAKRVPDRDLDIAAMQVIDGRLWLSTESGAFIIYGDNAKKVVDVDYELNQIVQAAGHVWLATDEGAFRVDGPISNDIHQPIPYRKIRLIIPSDPSLLLTWKAGEIFKISENMGQVRLAGTSGVFRVDGDVAYREPDKQISTPNLVTAGGYIWLGTHDGAYRINPADNKIQRIPDMPLNVTNITEINGKVWLSTRTGAYVVDGDTAARIPNQQLSVFKIADIDGSVWLATSQGAFIVENKNVKPVFDRQIVVLGIYNTGGKVWLSTTRGVYGADIHKKLSIDLDPLQQSNGLQRAFMPPGFLPAGDYRLRIRLIDIRTGQSSNIKVGDYQAIASTDKNEFNAMLKAAITRSPNSITFSLKPGPIHIYTGIKSEGSGLTQQTLSVTVIPSILPLLILSGVVGLIILSLIILACAPYNTICNRILMVGVYRDYLSLGVIPALIALSPKVRLHILTRYYRALKSNSMPDTEIVFDDDAIESVIKLIHQDGAGIVYLSNQDARSLIAKLTGLYGQSKDDYLPLKIADYHEGTDTAAEAVQILSQQGGISDRKLGLGLLRKGGFMILINGNKEDDDSVIEEAKLYQYKESGASRIFPRETVNFINRYRRNNLICITTGHKIEETSYVARS